MATEFHRKTRLCDERIASADYGIVVITRTNYLHYIIIR